MRFTHLLLFFDRRFVPSNAVLAASPDVWDRQTQAQIESREGECKREVWGERNVKPVVHPHTVPIEVSMLLSCGFKERFECASMNTVERFGDESRDASAPVENSGVPAISIEEHWLRAALRAIPLSHQKHRNPRSILACEELLRDFEGV